MAERKIVASATREEAETQKAMLVAAGWIVTGPTPWDTLIWDGTPADREAYHNDMIDGAWVVEGTR